MLLLWKEKNKWYVVCSVCVRVCYLIVMKNFLVTSFINFSCKKNYLFCDFQQLFCSYCLFSVIAYFIIISMVASSHSRHPLTHPSLSHFCIKPLLICIIPSRPYLIKHKVIIPFSNISLEFSFPSQIFRSSGNSWVCKYFTLEHLLKVFLRC